MMHDNKNQELTNKLKSFFNKKFNLILLIVLALAFFIRLKYMNVNAALWWDEADYMTLAKHYGLGLPEQAAPWRARAFSMLLSIFYFLGAGEGFMRFLWVIMSLAGVYFTYKLGKEFYNKTIGLIAAIGLSVYFEYLFWSARFSLDVVVVLLSTIIIYLFWKGYVKKQNKRYLYYAGGLLGYGIFAYESIAFLLLVFIAFLLFTEKLKFLKKKEIWITLLIMLIIMTPFFIYNKTKFNSFYPRATHQAKEFSPEAQNPDWQRAKSDIIKDLLTYSAKFPYYLKTPFMIAFIFGLITFTNLFLGFDLVIKGKVKKLRSDLFILFWCLIVLILFSFIMAFTGFYFEPRFLFLMMPGVFIIVGKGFVKIYDYLKKFNPLVALAIVLFLLIAGIYSQLTFADQLINFKKDTYAAEKDAGLWLKERTSKGENIIGCGQTVQIIYYSERQFYSIGSNTTRIPEYVKKYRPRFFLMDGHDPSCQNILNYPLQHPDLFTPLQAFFMDKEKTKPIMIAFAINMTAFN